MTQGLQKRLAPLMGLLMIMMLSACASPTTSPEAEAAQPEASSAATEAPAGPPDAPAVGLDVHHPMPIGASPIATAGWEFTVLEVLRGEPALAMVEAASSFNGPPEDQNLEWALVRLRVKYVGDSTTPMRVAKAFFESAGSDGTIYDRPKINDVENVQPELDALLLPGEEAEGWVTLFAPKGDLSLILVIQPYVYDGDLGVSTGEADRRYLSLLAD